jgi:hypothetical protein
VCSPSHITPLDFVTHSSGRSTLLLTTRARNIMQRPDFSEVQCGTMSNEASLEMLLRARVLGASVGKQQRVRQRYIEGAARQTSATRRQSR